MQAFKQIVPITGIGKEFVGYISALNEEFYIQLTVFNDNFPRKFNLRGCKKFQEFLQPVLDTLNQHLKQSMTVYDMLSEIQCILEQQIRIKNVNKHVDHYAEYAILFEQLQNCGWEKVHHLSADFHEIHFKAIDESSREHILKVWIHEKFPNEGPKCECDLPHEFNYKWLSDDSLQNLFSAFQEKLICFAQFWNNMDEIDEKTWVLEPEKPRRKDCKRRIALASGISLLVMIDPLAPTSLPTCHYLGPERMVEPFREKFNKNIHLWSEYDSVLHNLQQVLELEFPSPSTSVKEEFCMECGICYSYLLGEAVPDLTCDNSNCNQPFHHACLYEYIRMLPEVKSSFNKLFGQCPYCSKPLWCTIP